MVGTCTKEEDPDRSYFRNTIERLDISGGIGNAKSWETLIIPETPTGCMLKIA